MQVEGKKEDDKQSFDDKMYELVISLVKFVDNVDKKNKKQH